MKPTLQFLAGLVLGAVLMFACVNRYTITESSGSLARVIKLDRLTGRTWSADVSSTTWDKMETP